MTYKGRHRDERKCVDCGGFFTQAWEETRCVPCGLEEKVRRAVALAAMIEKAEQERKRLARPGKEPGYCACGNKLSMADRHGRCMFCEYPILLRSYGT